MAEMQAESLEGEKNRRPQGAPADPVWAADWPRGGLETCRYLAIPTPSSQPVCSTTACWGGAMLRVFISVPPTARIR